MVLALTSIVSLKGTTPYCPLDDTNKEEAPLSLTRVGKCMFCLKTPMS